jgi:hypothetical protein
LNKPLKLPLHKADLLAFVVCPWKTKRVTQPYSAISCKMELIVAFLVTEGSSLTEENLIDLEGKFHDAYNLAQDDIFGYPWNSQYRQFSSVVADRSALGSIRRRVEEQVISGNFLVPVSKSSPRFLQEEISKRVPLEVQVTCPSTCEPMDMTSLETQQLSVQVIQEIETLKFC